MGTQLKSTMEPIIIHIKSPHFLGIMKSKKRFGSFSSVCMGVFLTYMYVCDVNALCLWRPKEGIRPHRTGVTDGCRVPHQSWELNPGPLEEQPVPFTFEASLKP